MPGSGTRATAESQPFDTEAPFMLVNVGAFARERDLDPQNVASKNNLVGYSRRTLSSLLSAQS